MFIKFFSNGIVIRSIRWFFLKLAILKVCAFKATYWFRRLLHEYMNSNNLILLIFNNSDLGLLVNLIKLFIFYIPILFSFELSTFILIFLFFLTNLYLQNRVLYFSRNVFVSFIIFLWAFFFILVQISINFTYFLTLTIKLYYFLYFIHLYKLFFLV